MATNQDDLQRAYASLVQLNKVVPDGNPNNLLQERYVDLYHEQLDKLEAMGLNMTDFRIPAAQIKPRITSVTDAETHYSADKYTSQGYFKARLGALLMYFEMNTSSQSGKAQIGFRADGR